MACKKQYWYRGKERQVFVIYMSRVDSNGSARPESEDGIEAACDSEAPDFWRRYSCYEELPASEFEEFWPGGFFE